MRRVIRFLRLAFTRGWRPAWAFSGSALGVTAVGVVAFVVSGDPWSVVVAALVALLMVLVVGGFHAWDDADRRATAAESKAAMTDVLRQRSTELAAR